MNLLWPGFFLLVVLLLTIDLGLGPKSERLGLREAAWRSLCWISVGLGFTGFVWAAYQYGWFGLQVVGEGSGRLGPGAQAAIQYLAGYLLEESLSVDNLFVISVILTSFGVSPRYQQRVLFWGILGAIVARGAMIAGGVALVNRFDWLFYLMGAYLVFTGIRLLRSRDLAPDPHKLWIVRLARKVLPMARQGHGHHFVAREGGRLVFTPLFLALVAVEATDVVFAFDSVPAVLAITRDPFLVLSSNVFAVLGLRAIYFLLAEILRRITYLEWSLAAILVFIGAKMIAHDWVHVSTLTSLGVIVTLLGAGLAAYLIRPPARAAEEEDTVAVETEPDEPPPRRRGERGRSRRAAGG